MKPLRLLAVFAHPDDESFAAGGTLAKYAATGIEVVLVSATRGEAGIGGVVADQAGALREAELCRAAAELGASQVHFLGYRDGSLPDVDPQDAVDRLIALLNRVRPKVLITFGPDGISGHPDHVAVSRWVTAAFDALHGPDAPRKLYHVAPSLATEQACGVAGAPPLPAGAVGVDVEAHRVAKVRAMQAHASQVPPYPGDPIREAQRLECHEWFVLARSRLPAGNGRGGDLFAGLKRNEAL